MEKHYTIPEIIAKLGHVECYMSNCDVLIADMDVKHYEHSGGIFLECVIGKQWVYFECTNKSCGYQNSIPKILLKIQRLKHMEEYQK